MKAAIDITKHEIKWHKENRGDGPSATWEEAFIKGLEHLLFLFQDADSSEQAVTADECQDTECVESAKYEQKYHNCGPESQCFRR